MDKCYIDVCWSWDFPGNSVVRTLCRGTGLIPGQGTKIPQAGQCGQIFFLNVLSFMIRTGHTCGLPRWLSGKEFAYQYRSHRRCKLDP